ncbi:MAG: hypothetical protein RL722_517 [Pseudomonadota bacterium]|jgi:FtsP/CotA-like multicopper oxidase with cupredoxin domain
MISLPKKPGGAKPAIHARRPFAPRLHTALSALLPVLTVSGLSLSSPAVLAGPGVVDLGNGILSPTYYANSPSGVWASGSDSGKALRKFVDTLPGVGPAGANNFGNYIPVAQPEKWVTPGGVTTNDDYYELAIVEFTARAHSDLPAQALLRGYVQIATAAWLQANPGKGVPLFYPGVRQADGSFAPGAPIMITRDGVQLQAVAVDAPRPLGPVISAESGVAVRLLVRNLLPEARALLDANGKVIARNGDLFLPVDKSLIGAGVASDGRTYYTENRASVHLHGGDSPWISDGTPYQWIAPAGVAGVIGAEQAAMAAAAQAVGQPVPSFTPVSEFLRGSSALNVPDMPDPGPGAMTFYYPNKQSARMMWYHDHTVGLTRVNVYAGMAAGYLLSDATERSLVSSGALPGAANTVPLIFQDKTFVPQDIALQDRNWSTAAWGQPGDLWFPHVYESAGSTNLRNNGYAAAADEIDTNLGGANPAARWDYGPELGAINVAPPLMTGEYGRPEVAADGQIHSPSTTPEAFMDTVLLNGVAYPSLAVNPQAYRFRILNATNDRFMNLGLYVAEDDASAPVRNTEVRLIDVPAPGLPACTAIDPASGLDARNVDGTPCWPTRWPTSDNVILPRVPDPATAGPKIVQVGNETGWLQQTRHIVSTPASFAGSQMAGDGTALNNVGVHGLFLGNAERADVVIDFSAYAGKTLILYNDSPAPAPGFDDRYDYHTGSPDLSGAGGAESTKPGYGPNTRTVMQIRVAPLAQGQVAQPFDFAATDAAIPAAFAARNQPMPVVTADAVAALLADRATASLPAEVVGANRSVSIQSVGIVDKAILEEWDPNFGRLNAVFGIVTQTGPKSQTYADRPTEILRDGETTLWRITHTGVDTHPVHFHLVNVQIVARVNADGSVEAPNESEYGWKETVKMNPAQDVIVAFRPTKPELAGFTVPSSIRLLDPTQNVGAPHGFTQMDPVTGQPASVVNDLADLGWEYTWHCHILGHEENDFMRVLSFIPNEVPPAVPGLAGNATATAINLTFTDNADNEYAYLVERAPVIGGVTGTFVAVDRLLAQTGVGVSGRWTDTTAQPGQRYAYRVSALGSQTVGDTIKAVATPSAPLSLQLAAVGVAVAPIVSAITSTSLTLAFPAAQNASSYLVQQSADGGASWVAATAAVTLPVAPATGVSATVTGLVPGRDYLFRVVAVSGTLEATASPASTTAHTPASLVAPVMGLASSMVTDAATGAASITLNWTNASVGHTGVKIERFAGTLANSTRVSAVWTVLSAGIAPNLETYTDSTAVSGAAYVYRLTTFETVNGVTRLGLPVRQAATAAVNVVAPLGLKVTPAGATAMLSWTDASTNETSFSVERADITGGLAPVFAAVGTVTRNTALNRAAGGVVNFTDATALLGRTYVYQVKALNAPAGSTVSSSLPSNQVTISLVLAAPTRLSAVPAAATTTATPVTLAWTDASSAETAFEVWRSDNGASAALVGRVARTAAQASSANGAVSYSDVTTVPGVDYAYQVRAVKAAVAPAVQVNSDFSALASASITIAPASGLTATLGTSAAGVLIQPITLSWVDNASNETRYSISRLDNNSGAQVTLGPVARTAALAAGVATPVVYTDTSAAVGASYTYTVAAERVVGAVVYSASSNPSVTVTNTANATAVATPLALSANTASGVAVVLNWIDNSSNEASFSVRRSVDGGLNWTLVGTVTRTAAQRTGKGATTSYTDATAVVGTAYLYRVEANIPAVGAIPAQVLSSNTVSAQLLLAVPKAVAASRVATGVVVSWSDASNNESGFQVVRTDPLGAQVVTTVASSAAQKAAVGGARNWTDASAAVGVSYSYLVRAVVYTGRAAAPAVSATSADSESVVTP